ncbi:recombinase RecQ [Pasteurellaceae bacterium 15-036681]|nr:recombinase RecQ [Pasteurellaceae bacterium 15-036681]
MLDTIPAVLIIDLEVNPKTNQVFKLGAYRPDLELEFESGQIRGLPSFQQALAEMETKGLVAGAEFLMGHNFIHHDLTYLSSLLPKPTWLDLPIIDTLRLSPLAFPQNPYHRLIKNHKIISSAKNSPVADCKACWELFQDQCDAFAAKDPNELAIYKYLLGTLPITRNGQVIFESATYSKNEIVHLIKLLLKDSTSSLSNVIDTPLKVCRSRFLQLVKQDIDNPEIYMDLAYALSWLTVSGGQSVLAPWVRNQFPTTAKLITELRDYDCGQPNCHYCMDVLNPIAQLKRYFGQGGKINSFRPVKGVDGGQEIIVRSGMKGEHLLAILPTGGGKSLCFQLPALNRYYRNGGLTIVISPLQSLMKDQVDNLVNRGVLGVATLNGMLSVTERADVLDKVALGDIGILFIAPEQFRNTSFINAIQHRQINGWVFDEAHCLSKWGHDFRPDYLYAAKFIKKHHLERQNENIAPISCFTATAKPDVLRDITEHFRDEVGIEFKQFIGDNERVNLSYEVLETASNQKYNRIHELLHRELYNQSGGAVIFVARKRSAEQYADYLKTRGWACEHFHAGLAANTKADIQERFIQGELKVIVATNAFGMGVDKSDVRLVIHAEITGSLENYLQEAGRAGRDQKDAKCILLFDSQDVDTQFSLNRHSQLELRDLDQIWKKLGRLHHSATLHSEEEFPQLVITGGEILRDTEAYMSFDSDDMQADTKVKAALAWLERANLLERVENQTCIFPSRSGNITLEQAINKIKKANLGRRKEDLYRVVTELVYAAPNDEPLNTDSLAKATACSFTELRGILKSLEELGVLVNDTRMTINLRTDNSRPSEKRLVKVLEWEKQLWQLLRTEIPDAALQIWQNLALSAVCQKMRENYNQELIPADIKLLLQSISYDKASAKKGSSGSLEINDSGNDLLRVRFKYANESWDDLEERAVLRHQICSLLLPFLVQKTAGVRSKDAIVETSFGELRQLIDDDLALAALIPISERERYLKQALLFLHKQDVIKLNHGMTILRHSMTLKLNPKALQEQKRYVRDDYQHLQIFYKEKKFQIHVMHEYAIKALQSISQAWEMVGDYFTREEKEFKHKWFRGRFAELEESVSNETLKKITSNLNSQQKAIVIDKSDQNRLILAGPGSGKTRVIVHRVAYLLRVQHTDPSSIIVLAFNRLAAREIKRRLFDLVGNIASAVTVLTYDGMAMRLLGVRYDAQLEESQKTDDIFKHWCEQATQMLTTGLTTNAEEDDDRDRIMAGFRYILVDEYQDISEHHYNLVSALAGRQADDLSKLTIIAVGDDDQNIYAFNGSSNQYIQRFQQDYNVEVPDYLTYNYRSSPYIIEAANSVIQNMPQRLKAEQAITVNPERKNMAMGGIWQQQDSERQGKVRVIKLPATFSTQQRNNYQAQAVMQEIDRLRACADMKYNDIAILARDNIALKTVQAWCELNHIAYFLAKDKKNKIRLSSMREFVHLVEDLNRIPQWKAHAFMQLLTMREVGEKWQGYFEEIKQDFIQDYGITEENKEEQLFTHVALKEWLYQYVADSTDIRSKGIFLGTVHSAKGLEFKHVFVLDGHWQSADEAEQRLYYVAMTRAIETLTLVQSGNNHLWISRLAEDIDTVQVVNLREEPELDTEYRVLALSELDIGFCARSYQKPPVLTEEILTRLTLISQLKVGDSLQIRTNGSAYEFCRDGVAIARSSNKADLPPYSNKITAMVSEFYVRYKEQENEAFRDRYPEKINRWAVVIPQLIIDR